MVSLSELNKLYTLKKVDSTGCIACLLCLFFLDSSISQKPTCGDCCLQTGYTELNEPRRSINSRLERGQTPLCDRGIIQGWYRFTSFNGTQMPEESVQSFRCGTHSPIWLQGGHPTQQDVVFQSTACVSSFGNTCYDSLSIYVVNCSGYYVYYLYPLHYCAVAYCAGKMDYIILLAYRADVYFQALVVLRFAIRALLN